MSDTINLVVPGGVAQLVVNDDGSGKLFFASNYGNDPVTLTTDQMLALWGWIDQAMRKRLVAQLRQSGCEKQRPE